MRPGSGLGVQKPIARLLGWWGLREVLACSLGLVYRLLWLSWTSITYFPHPGEETSRALLFSRWNELIGLSQSYVAQKISVP
jgi:hypothetical protein